MLPSRTGVVSLLVVGCVLAIVLARPDDRGLFRGASSGGDWSEHLDRVDMVSTLSDLTLRDLPTRIRRSDRRYPPLLHVATAVTGRVLGHGEVAANRSMVLWLLLLAGSVGSLAAAWVDERTGWIAFAATATTPGLAANSLSYFFDLPMSALLWFSIAVLIRLQDLRPELAGALCGLVVAAAAMTKWTALPFAPPMVLGALLCCPTGRTRDRAWLRRRVRAAWPVAVVAGVLVGCWLSVSPTSWEHMQRTTGVSGAAPALVGLDGIRLAFYPFRAVTAIFSPILAALLLAALLPWFGGGRIGWPVIALTALGQGTFLLLFVPPQDARFLLTATPAILLAASIGVARLGVRRGAVAATIWAVVAVGVTADFHHAESGRLNAVWPDQPFDRGSLERRTTGRMTGRGISIGSTDPHAGWIAADQVGPPFYPGREELWSELRRVGATALVVEEGALGDFADATWWDYRRQLDAARGDVQIVTTRSWRDLDGGLPLSDLGWPDGVIGLTRHRRPAPALWKQAGQVADDQGGLTLWSPR